MPASAVLYPRIVSSIIVMFVLVTHVHRRFMADFLAT